MVNAKHSLNVEAQVLALQEEAVAENDYIDRAMQALGMRQHSGKMENVLCIVGKGTRAVSAYQKGALTGSTLEASRYLGTRLTRTGTFSYEQALRLHATRAQSRSPFRQRCSLFKGVVQGAALSGLDSYRCQGAAHAWGSCPHRSSPREVWKGSPEGYCEDEC